jgi:hypothetical protein
MSLSLNYLEFFFEEGENGGWDDPSNAAAIDAQDGDQLYLVRGSTVWTFSHLRF